MYIVIRMVLLIGMPISLVGMLGMAALCTVIDVPTTLYAYLAALPLLGGCLVSARMSGRRLRHGGFQCGMQTALLLTGIWWLMVLLVRGHAGMPWVLLAMLPVGMGGGVSGVQQTPIPIRRRSHLLIGTSRRLSTMPELYRKPKKQKNGKSTCNEQENMLY